jgi:hypothetical protein
MLVLDACVGGAKMYDGWHKNLGDSFISIDIRKGEWLQESDKRLCKKPLIVKPIVLADMKFLPFRGGIFDEINMDPPHFSCGLHSFLRLYYGSWSQEEVKESIKTANMEFARVLRPNGMLVLKIMPTDLDLYQKLLTNFVFHWRINTVRPSGICTGTRKEQNSATFCLGIKKDSKEKPS